MRDGNGIMDALDGDEAVRWSGRGSWRRSFPRFAVEALASILILTLGVTGYFGWLRIGGQSGWGPQAMLLYRLLGDVVSFGLTTWGAWGLMTATRDLAIHATAQYVVTDSRVLISSRVRPGHLLSLGLKDIAQIATVARGVEIRNAAGKVVHSLFGIQDAPGAHKALARGDRGPTRQGGHEAESAASA